MVSVRVLPSADVTIVCVRITSPFRFPTTFAVWASTRVSDATVPGPYGVVPVIGTSLPSYFAVHVQ